jgi:hypothetical protein
MQSSRDAHERCCDVVEDVQADRELDRAVLTTVGRIIYNDRIERTIPAKAGRVQVLRIINELARQPHPRRAPFTDLIPLLEGCSKAIKRRSLIFLISDFICVPGWKTVGFANRRHEVLHTVRPQGSRAS